jgi:hypothetical protein
MSCGMGYHKAYAKRRCFVSTAQPGDAMLLNMLRKLVQTLCDAM